MTPRTFLLVVLLGAILIYVSQNNAGRTAFTNPTQNQLPNSGLDQWNTTTALPNYWGASGWGGPTLTLAQLPNTQHTFAPNSLPTSAGFLDKGSSPTISSCPNWCTWRTMGVTAVPGSITSARFYYYPISFSRTSGSDGVRSLIRFTDTTGGTLLTKYGPILKETDFATTGWKNVVIQEVAPANAAKVYLAIEVGTTPTNQFVASFAVDDAWIESNTCIEDWQCSDYGACVNNLHTRTCTDQRNCGTTLNKPSESGTCTGDISLRIAQYKAGTISMIDLMQDITAYRQAYTSPTALTSRFDALVAAHPPRNIMPSYGWQGALGADAYLTMYDATRNQTYLNAAEAMLDSQIQTWNPLWTTPVSYCKAGQNSCEWGLGRTPAEPANDTAQGGATITNFLRYAYLVKRDNIANKNTKAQTYYDFSKNNFLVYWDHYFKNFTYNTQPMGCLLNTNSPFMDDTAATWACDRWNAAGGVAKAFLYAHLYNTADVTYGDYATKQAQFFKAAGLHTAPACPSQTAAPRYEWSYRAHTGLPGDISSGYGFYEDSSYEGTNYAVADVDFIYTMYKHNIVFTSTDITYLVNTFKGMWNGDTTNPLLMNEVRCYDPNSGTAGVHNAGHTAHLQGFAQYASKDPQLSLIVQTIATKAATASLASSNGDITIYQCITDQLGQTICDSKESDYTTNREMIHQTTADLLYSYTS